jgi:hypothetical protein
MRLAPLLAALTLSSACVTVHETTRELPPPPPAAPPSVEPEQAPADAAPAAGGVSREEAIRLAFGYAQDRGLHVDRVVHAGVDASGRWEIELRGPEEGDRAKMLLDGRDGRLLKGRFRETGESLND